ncbi:MAG: HlyD family secretion protein [Bacteroidia bacterium]|jgi:multidrug resistance efflux pump|nr:HlyD family secretion protein [Bacteroidia bacterium]
MLDQTTDNPVGKKIESGKLYATQLLHTPRRFNVIRNWLTGALITLILCMFVPWQQNIQGSGKVTPFMPADRPQVIPSVIAGRIDKWVAREGQFVKKGDTILVLTEIKEKFLDPKLLARTDEQITSKQEAILSKREKIEALQKQVGALKAGLRFKLAQAKNKVTQMRFKVQGEKAEWEAAKVNERLAEDQFKRLEGLYKQGLASLTELQNRTNKTQEAQAKLISAENKYNTAQNELINAEIELNSVEAEYLDKISKAESTLNETAAEVFESQADVSKMQIEYSNIEQRSQYYVVRAPQDGFVIRASKAGIGEQIKEGDQVATIMPARAQLAVELYVKALDLPLLYEGCKVRVQFDGWPALVFSGWSNVSVGTFGGVVKVIDRVNSPNGKFRILVTPDPEDDPWPELVRAGSGAYGWAMLNNVALGYELWRQFNGFPPDMVKELDLSNGYSNGKSDADKAADEEDKKNEAKAKSTKE